jgi:hypothetical protein
METNCKLYLMYIFFDTSTLLSKTMVTRSLKIMNMWLLSSLLQSYKTMVCNLKSIDFSLKSLIYDFFVKSTFFFNSFWTLNQPQHWFISKSINIFNTFWFLLFTTKQNFKNKNFYNDKSALLNKLCEII